jgi:hypothetical protein
VKPPSKQILAGNHGICRMLPTFPSTSPSTPSHHTRNQASDAPPFAVTKVPIRPSTLPHASRMHTDTDLKSACVDFYSCGYQRPKCPKDMLFGPIIRAFSRSLSAYLLFRMRAACTLTFASTARLISTQLPSDGDPLEVRS